MRSPSLQGFPDLGRTRVVGVVNATPDSFSDAHPSATSAVRHGLALLAAGADVLDVGGESTRPGATRVGPDEELRRAVPVVRALVDEGAVVGIDTTRAVVARAALDAGAVLVNDVSGGLGDSTLLPLVAARGCACVLMHWRGPSADMQTRALYDDVVREVVDALTDRLAAAAAAGVAEHQVVLDPGLGFAKTAEHNWALLRALPVLTGVRRPVLVGASRKSFLGALLAGPHGEPRPAQERDAATAALTVLAAQAGAWGVRVHDVAASADAVRVVQRLTQETAGQSAAPDGGPDTTRDSPPGSTGPVTRPPPGDRITLTGLRVRGHHGVLAQERRDGQDFVVDAVLELDLRRAGRSADVADTVHYGVLAERLAAVVAGEPVDLLETLAERLAAVCLADPRVRRVQVTVHKPDAPIPLSFADVSVTLVRP